MVEFSFVTQTVNEILDRWGLSHAVNSQTIADLVASGSAYWEQGLPDGSRLALIRLFSPVVRREEVFLGNILLNDFLSKTLIRAVEEGGLGRMQLLANDLESYYYLYHGQAGLENVVESFRQDVLARLPDLYFGDEDPDRGIYGSVGQMLTFQLANREPFPVFTVPKALLPTLLKKANSHVRSLDAASLDIQRTIATVSFFYARGTRKVYKFDKKKGAYFQRSVSEMQSDFAFLIGAAEDGLLPYNELREAFVLGEGEELTEQIYRDRKKSGAIDKNKFMAAIDIFLSNIEARITEEGVHAVLASLHGKALCVELRDVVECLLSGVQIGFLGFGAKTTEGLPCRFCGASNAVVREKTIIAGTGMTKFFNQAPKQPHPKNPGRESLCIRCGISSYLETKLLGVMFSADMPVPRQYNIVFHYGRHDETATQDLAHLIDDILELIRSFRQQVESQRAKGETTFFSLEYVQKELSRRTEERRVQESTDQEEILSAEEALAALIADEATVPGVEILGYMRPEVETQVYALGMGDYRLLVFILPQFEPLVRRRDGRLEVDWDFIPKRFSRSRLAAFTLLALLRKLCGCDGPYYFQSVPILVPGGFDTNTFYVQGKAENADKAIRRYSAVVNFARRVINAGRVRERGGSPIAEWILLAEQLEEDALCTFSDVLRRTPMRRRDFSKENRDKFEYRPLAKYETIDEMGVIDGTEYLRLIEHLKQQDAIDCNTPGPRRWVMPRQVDTAKLDEFCGLLFRTLDRLGGDLLPLFLSDRPTSFEKYPRLLLGHIRYYNDVEAGFEEWKTKVLRDAYRREEEFPELLSLKKWLLDYRDLFENRKDNLNHLKRSLFARVYEYLYPRRLLTGAYAEINRGNPEALEEAAIRAKFRQVVQPHIEKLSKVYGKGERLQTIVTEAEEFLIVNRQRYRWKLREMEVETTPEEAEKA